MKPIGILAAVLLLSALPAAAAGSQGLPTWGAQIQLHHVEDNDDRCDIQINNLTGQQIVWLNDDSAPGTMQAWAVTLNNFAPMGWQSTLDSGTPSSLTTIRYWHTTAANFWSQEYRIWCGYNCPNTPSGLGWYNFRLFTQNQSSINLASDLDLAFKIEESVVNAAEIVCGDEEAWLDLVENVADAVEEGNEMANAPNYAWAGICYPDNDLFTPANDLAYPVIVGSKKDHVAIDINDQFVAQIITVNQASSITGNTQYIVTFYTRAQWNTANGNMKNPSPPPVRASSLPK